MQNLFVNFLFPMIVLELATFSAPYHGQLIVKTANFCYTTIFNVLGNPATQVPLGLGSWGVPLGIQVVAAKNQDRNCLSVAQELEKMFGGWVMPSKS